MTDDNPQAPNQEPPHEPTPDELQAWEAEADALLKSAEPGAAIIQLDATVEFDPNKDEFDKLHAQAYDALATNDDQPKPELN